MLDPIYSQAHGLQALAPARCLTRVVPVVASAREAGPSRALLRALEHGLKAMGRDVAVIEGVQGLQPGDARLGHRRVLQRWLKGVPEGTVVLLHAPVEALAVLLADSLARPVVGLNTTRRSVVDAYSALKVLVQVGGLQPIAVMCTGAQRDLARRSAQALIEGGTRSLGMVPPVWMLEYHEQPIDPLQAVPESFLLKVLDSALAMTWKGTPQDDSEPIERRTPHADPIVGVADVHRQRHA
jgi:hypothetical protein